MLKKVRVSGAVKYNYHRKGFKFKRGSDNTKRECGRRERGKQDSSVVKMGRKWKPYCSFIEQIVFFPKSVN